MGCNESPNNDQKFPKKIILFRNHYYMGVAAPPLSET
jgi:hypothetical protein